MLQCTKTYMWKIVHILYTQCTSEQVSLERTGFFRKQDLFISIGSDQINFGILSYICTKIAHYDTVQNFTKLLKWNFPGNPSRRQGDWGNRAPSDHLINIRVGRQAGLYGAGYHTNCAKILVYCLDNQREYLHLHTRLLGQRVLHCKPSTDHKNSFA